MGGSCVPAGGARPVLGESLHFSLLSHSVHLTLWCSSLLSPVTMLKWLHVTGKDQQINQLPHKKNNKNKSSLKHEVTSEDPVAVIDNYKFNITR